MMAKHGPSQSKQETVLYESRGYAVIQDIKCESHMGVSKSEEASWIVLRSEVLNVRGDGVRAAALTDTAGILLFESTRVTFSADRLLLFSFSCWFSAITKAMLT